EIFDFIEDNHPQIDEQLQWKEEQQRVRHAVSKLSEDQKKTIQSVYFKGLTQQKIAEEQQIPLGTVKGNEVYQVWLIKGDKPHPAGAFVTDKNGNGTVVYTMSQKEQTEKWDVMAITLEPNANNKTPKGNVVLSSAL
ncbi:sigma-70 family RNA polymerase sigma factor, partial [Priestia megaterium]|uniref:sigma-70 family RNA polymerase sigma factor n=1 Tax=Priestia megaterium TaxID=1404 RepID=UPI002FFFC76C